MNNTFLEDEENAVTEDKGSISKYQLKIQHLNGLNQKFSIENTQLRQKIKLLEQQNKSLLGEHIDQNSLIASLSQQLETQKQKNFQLSKKNEQLMATILLNEQLSIQTKKQSTSYVNRYEQKILELRQNLQMKQLQVQAIEQKYEKFKPLQLPMNTKNTNRFTSELLKYQTLIQQLIAEKNNDTFRKMEQINNVLTHFNNEPQTTKSKKQKNQKGSCTTDVRTNLHTLGSQPTFLGQINQQKLEIMFLRLNFELRKLKQKYRQKVDDLIELKNKDKVMKQGYNTLTKQMEKIRNQNCQLKIQLDHLDKKFKTCKDLSSRVHSVGNIPKRSRQKQNAESRISSEASIEGNCSLTKQNLKINPHSQTKYDTLQVTKSHNFDEKIQNIEGILSLDSSPNFDRFRNGNQNDQNDQELSICEQNQVDMSISLDASGFQAPSRHYHEISEHILTGLIDKKVF